MLGGSLLLILLAAEFFTNGVEHLGARLNLGEGAVGGVLAAVGTAMPETLVPFAAIVLSRSEGHDAIGVGAILGAPFMLSTLALAITGTAAFAYAGRREKGFILDLHRGSVIRDLRCFLGLYAIAVGASFVPQGFSRWGICALLLGAYAIYLRNSLKSSGALVEDTRPLRLQAVWTRLSLTRLPEETREAFLHRRSKHENGPPAMALTVVQVAASLALLLVGARLFVLHVEHLAVMLGVSGLIIALILAPVATELPEKMNSVIWVREGKERLSLANITGAMVFQSTIPTSLGIALTNWQLHGANMPGHSALFSIFIATAAALFVMVFVGLHRPDEAGRIKVNPLGLMAGFPLYILFILSIKFQW